MLGVNALSGLLSFLQGVERLVIISKEGVNALSGLLSFLHEAGVSPEKIERMCQCPKRATLISTCKPIMQFVVEECVSMP